MPSAKAQTNRNAGIIRDRARGLGWATVADRAGLTTRQAQKIYANWREEEQADPVDVQAEVFDEIAFLDASIEELAELAEATANHAVRLGAIKAKIDAQARRVELKRILGVLPWKLANVQLASEADRLSEALAIALHKVALEWPPGVMTEYAATVMTILDEDPNVARLRTKNAQEKDRLKLKQERRSRELEQRRNTDSHSTGNGRREPEEPGSCLGRSSD